MLTRSHNWLGLVEQALHAATLEAPALGPQAGPPLAALAQWIGGVARLGERVNLTGARSAKELVDLLLADAVVVAARVGEARTLVDVGSGAGAPGLPIALLCPALRVTLVEARQKRAALLRLAVSETGAHNARVVQARAASSELPHHDVAVSRATLPPPRWLALGTELAPDGEIWVFLGSAGEPPRAPAGWRVTETVRYRWPLTGVEHVAVRYANSWPERGGRATSRTSR
jgi:16S rRNA (guanine527-N7)-methyltransferase